MATDWIAVWIDSWRERTLDGLRTGATTPELIRERFRSPILPGIKRGMEQALIEFTREQTNPAN